MRQVREALDRRASPVEIFFRNDDAGWAQDALDRMLDMFADLNLPIDLAVIPAALDAEGAGRLNRWRSDHPGIGLHQHGYAHTNHEPEGSRRCEFGAARSGERHLADVASGRMRIYAMLGETDPIFTPPWNRIAPETAGAIVQLGFALISDDGALAKAECDVPLLPVSFDWEKARRTDEIEGSLARSIAQATAPLGIMLHHETMDASALETLREFLTVLNVGTRAAAFPMRRWIGAAP